MSVDDLTNLRMLISDGQQVDNETKQTILPGLTEAQIKKPLYLDRSNDDSTVPLFMRDTRNCDQGNAQDEKDTTEE